jgi:hypothetical protein
VFSYKGSAFALTGVYLLKTPALRKKPEWNSIGDEGDKKKKDYS